MPGTVAESVAAELAGRREKYPFPPDLRSRAAGFAGDVLGLMFPHFATDVSCSQDSVIECLAQARARFLRVVSGIDASFDAEPAWDALRNELLTIIRLLDQDAQAIYHGDPAARSLDEVILSYPGFYAIAIQRVAHQLWTSDVPTLPRLLTEIAHRDTGIDIHPGAHIGRSFAIDHGTGVVVGETATIGNRVRLYQGVTMGALTVQKSLASKKRHPTIEDDVVIYANATVLGGETIVGHDTVIGASAWITESVPPYSVVGRNSDVRPRRVNDPELEFNI